MPFNCTLITLFSIRFSPVTSVSFVSISLPSASAYVLYPITGTFSASKVIRTVLAIYGCLNLSLGKSKPNVTPKSSSLNGIELPSASISLYSGTVISSISYAHFLSQPDLRTISKSTDITPVLSLPVVLNTENGIASQYFSNTEVSILSAI